MEGPYGSPMIDLHGGRFRHFLLISGGLGWTFTRGWKRQLVDDASRGRDVHRIHSVVVLRGSESAQVDEIGGWECADGERWPEGLIGVVRRASSTLASSHPRVCSSRLCIATCATS
jgi:hypothetical protein